MALNSTQRADLKLAKKNTDFVYLMRMEGKTRPPGMFDDVVDEGMYIAAYFGYLIGKYGSDWEANK